MNERPTPFIAGVFVMIVFLTIGVLCLFWPEKVRQHGLWWSGHRKGRFIPFLKWMRTPSYLLSVRVTGVIAIACSRCRRRARLRILQRRIV